MLDAREGTGITGAVKVSINDGTVNGRFKKIKTGLTEDGSGPQYSSQWSKQRWQHHWNRPQWQLEVIASDKIWLIPLPRQLDCGEVEEPEDGPAACTRTNN